MVTACTLVDPTSAPAPAPQEIPGVPPVDSLDGRRIALLKNAWPSWHRMTDRLERLLTERVAEVTARQHLIPTPRSDVSAMLTVLGDALGYLGNPNVVMGKGTVAVLLTPGHAQAMARAGLSKADVAAEVWARSAIPLARFPAAAHPDPPYEFIVRDGRVYPVAGPGQVYVIVAGGPEPTHATVVPSHPSCRSVTEHIGDHPGTTGNPAT